ncbi:hypothetical protein LCGC14_2991230 [marine sediment metagenome]|uniref:Rhamnogalacturonase A/B/Epimerase-like pectate lyase domain-containing protein n=1 Tax=marine sediment metagenome TaxID=412755 RepID=A0A0F8X3Q0_9ZZZZ
MTVLTACRANRAPAATIRAWLWLALLTPALLSMACSAMAGSASLQTVSVADFGAVPDDGKDDTAAVNRAIAVAVKRSGSALIFPTGRYDFASDHRIDKSRFDSRTDRCLTFQLAGQYKKRL